MNAAPARRSGFRPAAWLAAAALLLAPSGASALGHPGDLDPTFHGGAPTLADLAKTFPHNTGFSDLLVDGSGRIVIVGNSTDPNGFTATVAARYDGNGNPDPSFAGTGSELLQLGPDRPGAGPVSFARTVFARPGGYVGYGVYRLSGDSRTSRGDHSAQLLRADGSRDLDFGSAGLLTRDPVSAPANVNTNAAVAGPDGSVYVAGTYDNDLFQRRVALTKFNPSGVLATGWGNTNGTDVLDFSRSGSPGSYGSALLMLPNNRLLVGGVALLPSGRFGLLVVRVDTTNGAVDTSFGPDGTGAFTFDGSDPTPASPDSSVETLAQGPDGVIYLGGYGEDALGNTAALVARLTPAGHLDGSFGTGGVKRVQLGGLAERSDVSDIAVQPDGKIVVAAAVVPDGGGRSAGRLFRLNENGSLDTSFGTNGVATPTIGGHVLNPSAILVSGGRLLAAGSVQLGPSTTDGVLARLLLAPLPDPTPGGRSGGAGRSTPHRAGGISFRGRRKLAVDRRGRVSVRLSCSARGSCAGSLALVAARGRVVLARAKKRRRAAVYARKRYRIAAGRRKSIVLKLTARSKRAARRHGLRARLVLAPRGARRKTYAVKLGR